MHKLFPVEECLKVLLTETCLSVFKLYSIQHLTWVHAVDKSDKAGSDQYFAKLL